MLRARAHGGHTCHLQFATGVVDQTGCQRPIMNIVAALWRIARNSADYDQQQTESTLIHDRPGRCKASLSGRFMQPTRSCCDLFTGYSASPATLAIRRFLRASRAGRPMATARPRRILVLEFSPCQSSVHVRCRLPQRRAQRRAQGHHVQ